MHTHSTHSWETKATSHITL